MIFFISQLITRDLHFVAISIFQLNLQNHNYLLGDLMEYTGKREKSGAKLEIFMMIVVLKDESEKFGIRVDW